MSQKPKMFNVETCAIFAFVVYLKTFGDGAVSFYPCPSMGQFPISISITIIVFVTIKNLACVIDLHVFPFKAKCALISLRMKETASIC